MERTFPVQRRKLLHRVWHRSRAGVRPSHHARERPPSRLRSSPAHLPLMVPRQQKMMIIRDPEKPLYKDNDKQLETLQTRLGEIAKDKNITGEALRVLMHLYSKIPFGICKEINQEQIGRELKMKGQNVNRAVRLLVEKNILLKPTKLLGPKGLAPNPDYKHTTTEHNQSNQG